jgi:uncharacterized protein (TIGR01777 family)
MSRHILLTGGSGLVGSELTQYLLDKGYSVSHLSRKPGNDPNVKTYLWDVNKDQIDEHCIDGVDTIVHLAGAGVAEKRWTDKRKKEIVESRTKSIELVYQLLRTKPHQVKSIVSAAATGYYGDRGDELIIEDSPPANDFLANCCMQWELAVDKGKDLGLRILKFRTGVILSNKGGALPLMAKPVKFGVGSSLGTGRQWIPWIHHKDVIDLYIYGLENNELSGVYNMVAPNPVTNKQLTKIIAKQLHRPLWLPNVPAVLLKLLLGEMSIIVLGGAKVSAQKTEAGGFKFKYPIIEDALKEIYD